MYGNGISAYRKNEILTADPNRLVLMCYDAAIRNLKIAKSKSNEKERAEKDKAVQKTTDIIGELLTALDLEKGREIARNLSALYKYMLRRITVADVNKDSKAYDEVIRILEELGDAWRTLVMAKRPKTGNPTVQKSVSMA